MSKQTFEVGQRVYVHRYGTRWDEGVVTRVHFRRAWGSYTNDAHEYIDVQMVGGWKTEKLNNRRLILCEREYDERIQPQIEAQAQIRAEAEASVKANYKRHARAINEIADGLLRKRNYRSVPEIAAYLQEHFNLKAGVEA